YGTGPELSDATILPRSVAPVVTTIRASVVPAVTPVGALGARPLADATSSYSPGGTSTWNRPAGSITDCAVYSARAAPWRRSTSSVYAGTTSPEAVTTVPSIGLPTGIVSFTPVAPP